MSRPPGAGFHAHVFGPLPFAFGPVPPERYQILQLTPRADPGRQGTVQRP